MTLEEKAEEYVIKNVCENCNHCQSKGYMGCDTYRFAKKTYIDSAKENGIQLHDLRKDPNDLPKENCKVYLYAKDKEYYMGSFENGAWKYDGGFYASDDFVIAWCEKPTFDKE